MMKDKTVILVVDDQPQNIDLLEAYLAPNGYEIVTAVSGEEALRKLSGNQIDLILLDIMMPGMNGFEVTRRVRQNHPLRLLPIMLVTALHEAKDRVMGIEAGCDDFISKPVDKMELLSRVRSLLKIKDYNDLISNYREELESEVTRRTEELNRIIKELQESKGILIQSEKLAAIGRLSAGVALEILNPVNIISMRLKLLEETEGISDTLHETLQVCQKQIDRIIKITKDISQFSRFPTKSMEVCDLNGIVEQTLQVAAPRLTVGKITSEVHVSPDLPHITIDRYRIAQVLLTLINNAIDAMENMDKKDLYISTEQTSSDDGRQWARITVSDTGQGINEAERSKIFDPFFTTKERGKGTGLGLSIAYSIIQDHQGTITVKNNENGSVSFIIDLLHNKKSRYCNYDGYTSV